MGTRRALRTFSALTLLALFFLASCSSGGDSGGDGSTGGPFISPLKEGVYSFTIDQVNINATTSGFVSVQASINGVSGVFLLDSGTSTFTVSPEFAEQVGLEVVGSSRLTTIAGTSLLPVRAVPTLSIGNVEITDLQAIEAPTGTFAGTLGAPFFRNVIVGIDYKFRVVLLGNPLTVAIQATPGTDSQRIDISELSIAQVSVNGQFIGPVLIDTGSNGGIHTSEAKGGDLLDGATETRDEVFTSFNGEVLGKSFIANTVKVDRFVLTNQLVAVQEPDIWRTVMGNSILQQFILLIDYRRDTAIFSLEQHIPQTLRVRGGTADRLSQFVVPAE